ncbi:MAG: hypothetical protein AAB489_05540 [Patescibacteria group bacterium]
MSPEQTSAQNPPAAAPRPERDVEENKDIAAFSYLWVMSVVVWFLKKDSPFVRFHSRQAIVLFVLSVIIWIIPVEFVSRLLEIVILAGMVIGFLNAAQGQRKDIPLVGPFSRGEMGLRQAWREILNVCVAIASRVRAMFRFRKRGAPNDKAHPVPSVPTVPTVPVMTSLENPEPSPPPSK